VTGGAVHLPMTLPNLAFHFPTAALLTWPALIFFVIHQKKAAEEALQVAAEGAGGLADSARDAAGLLQDAAAGVHKHNKKASRQAANNQEL